MIYVNPPEEAIAKIVVHTHTEDSGEISRQEGPDESSSTSIILEEPIEEDLGDGVTGTSTPLHEAAKSGDCERVVELLEEGMDPCAKDERGRTPYMLANEKEVRNTFRRFMASNLEKWNWHDAKVPSPLTKEMEESQAAKQVLCIDLLFADFRSFVRTPHQGNIGLEQNGYMWCRGVLGSDVRQIHSSIWGCIKVMHSSSHDFVLRGIGIQHMGF